MNQDSGNGNANIVSFHSDLSTPYCSGRVGVLHFRVKNMTVLGLFVFCLIQNKKTSLIIT